MPCPSLTSTFPHWLTIASSFLFEHSKTVLNQHFLLYTECSSPWPLHTAQKAPHCDLCILPFPSLGFWHKWQLPQEDFPDSLQQFYLTVQQWLFRYKFFVLFCLFKNIYYHLKLFIYLLSSLSTTLLDPPRYYYPIFDPEETLSKHYKVNEEAHIN